ncbi:MAG: hypothetical protein K8U57_33685 [Planctomycetes bacterium]|nr:hypothetical protein [Planctomycetota bacterium]
MFRFTFKTTLAALVFFGSATFFLAQEPKKADPAGDEKQVIKTKPTKVTPAASVKFRKDLGLPLPSLNTLGSRIDAARRAGDPVTLAHAASELATAEKVSGKTASLASPQLLAEAAELASVRKQEAELKSVLQVSQQLSAAEGQLTNLKQQIAAAQAQTAADKQSLLKNEEPTSAPRKIIVNNYSTQYIEIQVNGYIKGQVSPGSTQVFTVEQRWNPIVLKGWGDEDAYVFGPVVLQGRFDKYTWNINNDDATPTPLMP